MRTSAQTEHGEYLGGPQQQADPALSHSDLSIIVCFQCMSNACPSLDAATPGLLEVVWLVVPARHKQRFAFLVAVVLLLSVAVQVAGQGHVGGQAVPHAVAHRRANAVVVLIESTAARM